jgi:glutathione S-transferase
MIEDINHDQLTIVGSPLSPYVRKVLVCLKLKNVAVRVVPLIPWFDPDDISHLNPLQRIPILVDGDFILPDSSVIAEYIEERFPETSLYPSNVEMRAKARWLEEFADTKLFGGLVASLFFEQLAKPNMLKQEPDHTRVENALTKEIPESLTYLEGIVPENGFMFDAISIADIALATPFRNAFLTGWTVDVALFPKTASYIDRVHALPVFQELATVEMELLKTKQDDAQELMDRFFIT